MSSERPDHGVFQIPQQAQEAELLAQLQLQAASNPQRPGQAWGRIEATLTEEDGRTRTGHRVYHLDLVAGRLTITEEWDGEETARQTISLRTAEQLAALEVGTVPPPEPGDDAVHLERRAFAAADLDIEDELRAWAREQVDLEVLHRAAVPRRIRVFGDRFQELCTLPRALAPGPAPGTGATLDLLGARPGVRRRLVEGWLDEAPGRGTAFILEACPDGGWWLALRDFERCPGLLGKAHGPWREREGRDPAELPAALQAVLVPADGDSPLPLPAPEEPPPPDIALATGDLAAGEAAPTTAEDTAQRVGQAFERGCMVGHALEGARVTVFRGAGWESWQLTGALPLDIDDLVRGICRWGEEPQAVALTREEVLLFDGHPYRALVTDGEAGGRRFSRALLIRQAPDGQVLGHQLVARDFGEVGHRGWIGVAPISDLSLFPLGAPEA